MENKNNIHIKISSTNNSKSIVMEAICVAIYGGTGYVRTAKDLPEGHDPHRIIPAGTKCEIIDRAEWKFGEGWLDSGLWPVDWYKQRVESGDIPDDGDAYYVKLCESLEGRVLHLSELDFEQIEIEFEEE